MTYISPDPKLPWPISYEAVKLIAESEGLKLHAYRCPAGVWTIARGRTEGVKPGDGCTVQQADEWFLEDLNTFTNGVRAALTRAASMNELGALVSLAYNIGLGALRRSTALRKHNEGDAIGASEAIKLWNKARVNGQLTVLPGLVTRRAREAALYLTPDAPEQSLAPVSHAVEPEDNPLKHSRTMIAGGAGAGLLSLDLIVPWLLGDDATHVMALLGSESDVVKAGAVALLLYIMWVRRDDWIRKLR